LGAIVISVLFQILETRITLLQTALGIVPLTWADWGLITLVASSIFFADELRKFVQKRRRT